MTPFKKGDKVECVSDERNGISFGNIYEIRKLDDDKLKVVGSDYRYPCNDFILSQDEHQLGCDLCKNLCDKDLIVHIKDDLKVCKDCFDKNRSTDGGWGSLLRKALQQQNTVSVEEHMKDRVHRYTNKFRDGNTFWEMFRSEFNLLQKQLGSNTTNSDVHTQTTK